MSNVTAKSRSFESIESEDLERLAEIEREDRADRFRRRPMWKELYNDRLLCVALCQGAAQHILDGTTGINDFDVWTFYSEHPDKAFPPRWRLAHDFGSNKFGQSEDSPQYVGRRVDCISRSIAVAKDQDGLDALRSYLLAGRTESAKFLRAKSIILLAPTPRIGEAVWTPDMLSKEKSAKSR